MSEYPWNEKDIRFVWLSSLCNPFNSFGERSIAKKYCPVSLFSVICKILEKLLNYELFNDSEKCVLFFIYNVVSGLLDQLQIFWQMSLVELLGFLVNLGLLELWHLMYARLSTGCDILVFFTKSYEISLKLFGHIKYFLKNKWLLFSFWMGSLAKCIQLILEFLKAPFLVLHYSYYI